MKKLTRVQKRNFLILGISILILLIGFWVAYQLNVSQIENQYKEKLFNLETTINKNRKTVFVAKKEIKEGEPIRKKNVEQVEVFVSENTEGYISQKDFGRLAAINIEKQQPILETMLLSNMDQGLREEEFGELLKLNSNLKNNNFVDVRIMFPNGENQIVLSKKAIKHLDLEKNNCFLWLNEEEIQRISGAIVDSYIHEGTYLYTTKYIENEQEKSISTYQPSESVMLEMANNPNIVEKAKMVLNLKARKEMEERMKQFHLEATKKDNKNDTKKESVDNEDSSYSVSEEDISYVN